MPEALDVCAGVETKVCLSGDKADLGLVDYTTTDYFSLSILAI